MQLQLLQHQQRQERVNNILKKINEAYPSKGDKLFLCPLQPSM
jgi:hypothetical protein